jgi:hypothetical protein
MTFLQKHCKPLVFLAGIALFAYNNADGIGKAGERPRQASSIVPFANYIKEKINTTRLEKKACGRHPGACVLAKRFSRPATNRSEGRPVHHRPL